MTVPKARPRIPTISHLTMLPAVRMEHEGIDHEVSAIASALILAGMPDGYEQLRGVDEATEGE